MKNLKATIHFKGDKVPHTDIPTLLYDIADSIGRGMLSSKSLLLDMDGIEIGNYEFDLQSKEEISRESYRADNNKKNSF